MLMRTVIAVRPERIRELGAIIVGEPPTVQDLIAQFGYEHCLFRVVGCIPITFADGQGHPG